MVFGLLLYWFSKYQGQSGSINESSFGNISTVPDVSDLLFFANCQISSKFLHRYALKVREHMCRIRCVAAVLRPHERVDTSVWVAHQYDTEYVETVP
jgi:hypothetical protein